MDSYCVVIVRGVSHEIHEMFLRNINAVDHNKIFDNDDPGRKTFFLSHNILRQQKCFAAWVIIIKNFNVINSIPAQALATPF